VADGGAVSARVRAVFDAVRRHGLPPASLGTVADRQAIYDRGLTRAAWLAAATPQELETVAMPLNINFL